MIIYFFTKEEIVCDSLIQAANFNGHECFVSKDFETIYEKILETQLEPDLFVLDYTLFNPLLFNPFKFLTSKNLFIPLIIYNDPFAPKEFKVGYWKNLLKTFYPTNRINFEKYNQIFTFRISGIYHSCKARISLGQSPNITFRFSEIYHCNVENVALGGIRKWRFTSLQTRTYLFQRRSRWIFSDLAGTDTWKN